MLRTIMQFSIVLVITMFTCQVIAVEVDRAEPRDPEVPWQGDPDLSLIKDERVLQLWDDSVKGYRRISPYRGLASSLHLVEEYTSLPKSSEDQEYLLQALEKQLKSDLIDWNYVRTILLLMMAGMDSTPKIPELAHYLFQLSRPIKMSMAHGLAYTGMVQLLGLQHTEASAAVLYAAAHPDYWGSDPMFSPMLSKTSAEESIWRLRNFAILALVKLPPQIRLPWFEKLAVDYPMTDEEEKIGLLKGGTNKPEFLFARSIKFYVQEVRQILDEQVEDDETATITQSD